MAPAFRVSNSSLQCYSKCLTCALLKYGLCLCVPEKAAPLLAGKAGHAGHEHYFKHNGDVQGALDVFQRLYIEYNIDNVTTEERLKYANTSIIFAYYLETHPLESFPFITFPELIEVTRFEALDDNGDFVFHSVLDMIVQERATGMVNVLDHKFTHRLSDWWLGKWKLSPQLTGYIWSARRAVQNTIVHGAYINAIAQGLLPGSTRDAKCTKHGRKYSECRKHHSDFALFTSTRSEYALIEWRKRAINTAKAFKYLLDNFSTVDALYYVPMDGQEKDACVFCEFNKFCAADRPREWIGTILQTRPDITSMYFENG